MAEHQPHVRRDRGRHVLHGCSHRVAQAAESVVHRVAHLADRGINPFGDLQGGIQDQPEDSHPDERVGVQRENVEYSSQRAGGQRRQPAQANRDHTGEEHADTDLGVGASVLGLVVQLVQVQPLRGQHPDPRDGFVQRRTGQGHDHQQERGAHRLDVQQPAQRLDEHQHRRAGDRPNHHPPGTALGPFHGANLVDHPANTSHLDQCPRSDH
ncbi:hypothetical protein GCM10023321_50460 [Pseudonocardia eucalypti]|uniref:Uncharacterized protein n=1 Tax=Pseudonocardia eucalypti TaxID=648755 RepID=A0ABP9QKN5_9PSEU